MPGATCLSSEIQAETGSIHVANVDTASTWKE
jgi:hypothetical protein